MYEHFVYSKYVLIYFVYPVYVYELIITNYNPNILNQELSVLYEGLTLNYGEQLSLYVPHMLRVNMARDLAHLQLSDLQGETRPIYRTSDLQGERMLICRTKWLFSLLKESQENSLTYFHMHFLFTFFIRRYFTY